MYIESGKLDISDGKYLKKIDKRFRQDILGPIKSAFYELTVQKYAERHTGEDTRRFARGLLIELSKI